MILDDLRPIADEFLPAFHDATGWELKPEGACRGDVCIPLGPEARPAPDGRVDVRLLAAAMGLPLVEGAGPGPAALGPDSIGGRTLSSAIAPELTLPTVDGEPFRLAAKHGERILLLAWSPY
jgi:hypothetical protein